MVGKTALNKERYHLNGGPFQTLDTIRYEYTYCNKGNTCS